MKRTYTNIGQSIKTEHGCCTPKIIDKAINTLEWVAVTSITSLPMSQGLAIKEIIKECKIPKVSHVAYMGSIVGYYGFYGIRGHYKNGTAEIFVMDTGTECTIMASDYYENLCLVN